MHRVIALGHSAMQLLQYTASLPGAVGSASPAIHFFTASAQWAMALMQCIASLLGDSGQCNSSNALPHLLAAVHSVTISMRGPTSWGDGESCPGGGRCLRSGTPAMHSLTACK